MTVSVVRSPQLDLIRRYAKLLREQETGSREPHAAAPAQGAEEERPGAAGPTRGAISPGHRSASGRGPAPPSPHRAHRLPN